LCLGATLIIQLLRKSLQCSKTNEDESTHIASTNTTQFAQCKSQTKGKVDQIVSWAQSKSIGEIKVSIDTGKDFKKPKIELSVAVIGSIFSFVASVDLEKCLNNKLKFTIAVILSTFLSLLFETLLMLFNTFYPAKAACIYKYITLPIATITNHLPGPLEKTKPHLISFYQDLCRAITSGTLVCILAFWFLMPSTEGSFQLRFKNSILIHIIATVVLHIVKAISYIWFKSIPLIANHLKEKTNVCSNGEEPSTEATQTINAPTTV